MGKEDGETDLSEQATAATSTEIDVHVVVLATDGFLDKRFFQDVAINDDGIAISTHGDLWGDAKVAEVDAELVDDELPELGVETGAAISGDFKTGRSGHVEMVEDGADETTVPEECLRGEIVYAKGPVELDVRDGLVEGEVGGKEGDEDVAARPVFDI